MSGEGAFVRSAGVVTPAGLGVEELARALERGQPCLRQATAFELPADRPALVGAVPEGALTDTPLPRTHRLALAAARAAVTGLSRPPEAVVVGVTTGGLPATEAPLRRGDTHPGAYTLHGPDTVTGAVAEAVGCTGWRLTLSTACSSGAVALAVGRELLRAGLARRVLAGGVDGLCQLTVQGFSLLRICDPRGARPLDLSRAGMTVAEGAAFLILDRDPPPRQPAAALVGAGHSCDAHHATAPDPAGEGAARAMRAALADAGLAPADVSYLNLHGTGTRDNDAAEAKAIHQVFAGAPPLVSSTKGLVGHALAASGAIEAALSSAVLATGVIPPNVGLQQVDPELGLDPVRTPTSHPATVVQSNSLGFGGSNASLVLSSGARAMTGDHRPELRPLWVYATGAISGAGVLGATWDALEDGHGPARSGSARSDSARSGSEMYLPDKALAKLLSGHPVRRLGRLFRLALAATLDAAPAPGPLEAPAPGPPGAPATAPPKAPATGPPGAPATAPPEAPATAPPEAPATAPPEAPATGPPEVEGIFYGTGWGALAETHDFLRRLWDSEGAFSSPTAFAASVHNAVAGQLAIHWQARGINLTAVGSRDALAQAALLAALLATERPCWLVAADAHHPELTPRLEGDYAGQPQGAHRAHRALESDGAAALLVRRARRAGPGALARLQVLELSGVPLPGTANRLTPPAGAEQAADAVLLATTEDPRRTTSEEKTSLVVPLHHHLGRHASVAGLGVALAVRALQEGHLPAGLTGTGARPLSRGRILVRSAGSLLAVEAP